MFRKILGLVALAAAPAARAAVLHVPADHATIQAAIDAAVAGDTVLVAPGTYPENLDFLGKAITVEGEAGPELTIVDAGRLGPAVRFRTGEGRGSVLSGFTLRNGFDGDGAGCVAIASASPTVTGNHVIGCESGYEGGGIAVSFSSPSIRGNVVVGNRVNGLGGGGILIRGAGSAEIVGNLLSDNEASYDGGGIELWAAGTPLISGNVIRDNGTSGTGGGIAMYNGSDADVVQNAIFGNRARTGGGVAFLVPSGNRGPLLVANTIAANVATEGSAIYASGFPGSVLLVNDLLSSPDATAAVLCDFMRSTVGPAFDHVLAHSAAGSAYAVCPDPTGTSGNLSAPPAFADAPAGDYRLAAALPAVDAGFAGAPLLPTLDLAGGPRVSGGAVDVGAWEYPGRGVSITPGRVDFGPVAAGTTATASVTVANAGVAGVTVGTAAVLAPFAVTGGTCAGVLAPGATCTIDVSFAPPSLGRHFGVLTPILDGARAGFPVVLAGAAGTVDLAFSPTELRMENVSVGQTSAPATVTITNPNAGAVAIDALTFTGEGAPFAQTNDCPASLPAGGSCTAAVTCTPGAAQWYMAALVPTGPFLTSRGVSLVCSGIPPVTPSVSISPPSVAVRAGGAATFSIALTRAEWLADALAITCITDAPAATCTVAPAILPAGGGSPSAGLSVQTTGGSPFSSAGGRGGAGAPALGLALLALGAAPLGRRRARTIVVVVALGVLSCIRTSHRTTTPPGAYGVSVTVASAAGSQTVQATLVVTR